MFIAISLTGENVLLELPLSAFAVALWLLVLIRFGLLALMISYLPIVLTGLTPITLRLSSWYAPRSVLVLLFIVVLALYGFRTSLAGRPVFGNLALDD